MNSKWEGAYSTLSGKPLKLIDNFKFLRNISCPESDANIHVEKARTYLHQLCVDPECSLEDLPEWGNG